MSKAVVTVDPSKYHVLQDLGNSWEEHPDLAHIQERIRMHAVPVGALIEDPSNVRVHPDENLEGIRGSFAKYQQRVLLVVNSRTMIVEKGNGSLRTLRAAGFKYAAVLFVDDDPATATGFAIADNRTAEQATWDLPALFKQLESLKEVGHDVPAIDDAFFEELKTLVGDAGFAEPGEDPGATEPPKDPVSKPGTVYELGPHRLMCGDSTDAASVNALLAGAAPRLMVTDPPYGVEYDPEWRSEALGDGADRREGRVQNDDRSDWSEAWALFVGDVAYVWHSPATVTESRQSLLSCGFKNPYQIIWAKPRLVLSRAHYHGQHEPCWYAVRNGSTAKWISDRSQTTLWTIGADATVEGDVKHGTQKPLECMERPIRHHAGDVYDPFLGSGTTLIAAARQGRKCFGMELEPAYCDVIRKRWGDYARSNGVEPGKDAL